MTFTPKHIGDYSPSQYERVVYDLMSLKIGSDFTSHYNKKYIGKHTGHPHQIDVSFEGDLAGASMLIIIECKFHKRPVSLEKVMILAFRLWDIGAQKGIMISGSEYQRGAFRIAQGVGLSLAMCRDQQVEFKLRRQTSKCRLADFLIFMPNLSMPIEYGVLESEEICTIYSAAGLERAIKSEIGGI